MTSNLLTIRKFDKNDDTELIHFWRNAFPNDPPHNAPEKMLHAKLAVDDLIYIVESEGQIVGACMAGYDGHRGWLYAVAVSSSHRRLGIGKQLITHTIQALKDLGCIKLNLQIRADNTQVKHFYQSLGFEVEERLSMGQFI